MQIRPFHLQDKPQAIALWQRCGLTRPWNDPGQDIARKMQVQPELFLVGLVQDQVIATAMAGYDGHRGSLYYFAVHPDYQGKGYARLLLQQVEQALLALGCPKLNLLIRTDNQAVRHLYEHLGYQQNEVLSLGHRLIVDD